MEINGLMTLQEYADIKLPERLRQPLLTIDEAASRHGWSRKDNSSLNPLMCCGCEVEDSTFLGITYAVICKICGKFLLDVTGPRFGDGAAFYPDPEIVDLNTDYERRWIVADEAQLNPLQ